MNSVNLPLQNSTAMAMLFERPILEPKPVTLLDLFLDSAWTPTVQYTYWFSKISLTIAEGNYNQ